MQPPSTPTSHATSNPPRASLENLRRAGLTPHNLLGFQAVLGSYGLTDTLRNLAKDRFLASDFAWLLTGIRYDGNHSVPFETPHVLFSQMWSQTKGPFRGKEERAAWRDQLKGLMYDVVSWIYICLLLAQ
jgi:hypothetical protein